MTLRYVPPDGEERGEALMEPAGGETGGGPVGAPVGAPVGDRRRRALSDPRWVLWVAVLVVCGTVLPLVLMPLSSMAARVGLAIAAGIALMIALSVRREAERIRSREEMRTAPKCRSCGRRYDEPLGEVVGLTGPRCMECGRGVG